MGVTFSIGVKMTRFCLFVIDKFLKLKGISKDCDSVSDCICTIHVVIVPSFFGMKKSTLIDIELQKEVKTFTVNIFNLPMILFTLRKVLKSVK